MSGKTKARGIVRRKLCMIMMLLNVSESVRGGSKRFNTCMSDGLTPDCLCGVCLPFRPFYFMKRYISML
jgi:hypothetical protein